MSAPELILRELGLADYQSTLTAMRQLTDSRVVDSPDELWLLQHSAVFTQGQAGKAQHILAPGDIPIIRADRGGQVTYHGPGQWVLYFMVDLRRGPLSVRDLVNMMERCVLQLLEDYMISAALKPGAPGVYVADEKIASLGLRIRRGCSYHGLALNVDMDLEPFGRINPCGYEGLQVTSMAEQLPGVGLKLDVIGRRLMNIAASMLSI
ncbi:MAG: lipoyl(octanoyl) transferase LipB [Halioglobus sp.]|nr:lipoyl(octanoyl) transferase LipB [Halioglobus sp.]